jgi:hypothetical protein
LLKNKPGRYILSLLLEFTWFEKAISVLTNLGVEVLAKPKPRVALKTGDAQDMIGYNNKGLAVFFNQKGVKLLKTVNAVGAAFIREYRVFKVFRSEETALDVLLMELKPALAHLALQSIPPKTLRNSLADI